MSKLALLAAFAALIAGAAVAQHAARPVSPDAAVRAEAEPLGPFAVRAYGAFRQFMQKQDYSAKIGLSEARASGATDGVGALAGLRGEISLIDGRYVVSHGGGCRDCPPVHAEQATLLGTARVRAWHDPVVLPATVSGKALDDFIIARARERGLDVDQPFPVRLKGVLVDVAMHVIEAPRTGFSGHGSTVPMAKQDEYRHDRLAGEVVGFHVPRALFGVLTHPGEPFHFHWISQDRTATAHLDAFGMEGGAELLLPKP